TGVYLLSQICVLATYWAVFELGCATVGIAHAVIAVMLMVGIVAFSLPTPEFGPAAIPMALAAVLLLHFRKRSAPTKGRYWGRAGVEVGLLVLTSYAGVVLSAIIIAFMVIAQRGRALLGSLEPWLAGVVVIIFGFPHLIWLDAQGSMVAPLLERVGSGLATAH